LAAKGNTYALDLLELIFNATAFSNVAINATSGPLTVLYVSLHTATPAAGGSQTTNEAAYTGYARVSVARTSSGWTITGGSVSPNANIVFPTATGGSETETFMGIGSAASGAGILFYFGAISPTITVSNGVTPTLTTATAVTEN
jgi:hypothetical protein